MSEVEQDVMEEIPSVYYLLLVKYGKDRAQRILKQWLDPELKK